MLTVDQLRVELQIVEGSDAFIRNEVAVCAALVTLDGRALRAAILTVPRSSMHHEVRLLAGRPLMPWRYPDRVVGWHVEPFPRATWLLDWLIDGWHTALDVWNDLRRALLG